jgi:glycosyltransferase involved in cell wall biosynthesis
MEFSIVIPVFNEEDSLKELQRRICNVMRKISSEYEIIYVDDGSRDASLEILKECYYYVKMLNYYYIKMLNFKQHIIDILSD